MREVGVRESRKEKSEIGIIGAGILDVLAYPAGPEVFERGTLPMEEIRLCFGGDALNEAVALSRLGKRVSLLTKVGEDEAGRMVRAHLQEVGVDTSLVRMEAGLSTGINVVLVDERGERSFLTNPRGSLRRLSREDILPWVESLPDLVCFASIFVSSLLGMEELFQVFQAIKARPGRVLAADITRPKKGETLEDMKKVLPLLDILFGNAQEIEALTGREDPQENARLLLQAGVGRVLIKLGERGCLAAEGEESAFLPAYPVEHCIDTTGAGDCFAAGFLKGLLEGGSLYECALWGNACASCTVEQVGAGEGVECLKAEERYRQLAKELNCVTFR